MPPENANAVSISPEANNQRIEERKETQKLKKYLFMNFPAFTGNKLSVKKRPVHS
jgi:hypothetical protein